MHEQIVEEVKPFMEIEDVGGADFRLRISGRIFEPKEGSIGKIKERIERLDYLPLFRKKEGKDVIELLPFFAKQPKGSPIILNIVLFVATIFSTLFVGSMHQLGNLPSRLEQLLLGLPFSFSLMAILTSHELGHYFTARKNRVKATLPFFLPIPHPLLGTLGAIIRIKTIIPNRRALARLGIAGPVSGFLVALPITIAGLVLSQVKPVSAGSGIQLGNSLLFALLANIIHPHLLPNHDIFLHPMAYAGWLGFLVTSMNLMPIGQLDGGHIAYALLGKRRLFLIPVMIGGLLFFGWKWAFGWLFWIGLAIFLSLREPLVQDRITPLSTRDTILAIIPYAILILTFTPVPFTIQ